MTKSDNVEATLEQLPETRDRLLKEIRKGIIGQDDVIEQLLVTLLAKGHSLIEGVPGVAKTITAKLLAKSLSVDFSRIQFTPDLMPSVILGTSIFNVKTMSLNTKKAPSSLILF